MSYTVVEVGVDHIVIWDGTKDAKYPSKKAGLITVYVGRHEFQLDQTVRLSVSDYREPVKLAVDTLGLSVVRWRVCKIHNAYHPVSPSCLR